MASCADKKETLIAVEDISFRYDRAVVLKEVSFSIHSGDFLAIVGPNGSGKTTLIKVILGLLKPFKGRVTIMGQPIYEFTNWSKIGYVPQNATHFNPNFPVSVKEVIAMALNKTQKGTRLPRGEEEELIHKTLKHVTMEDYKEYQIGKLSGGQQQRVFIARAIVLQPKVLFLDEPTTGIDAQAQDRFYDMLGHLNENEKITIVLITHETGVINRHVSQVACLNQKMIYHGSHSEFCQSQAFRDMLAKGHHLVSHRH